MQKVFLFTSVARVCLYSGQMFFFLKHTGELHIIILEEKGQSLEQLQSYTLTPYTNSVQVTSASIWKELAYDLSGWQLSRQVGDPSCPG
jgi:hypothetical protein